MWLCGKATPKPPAIGEKKIGSSIRPYKTSFFYNLSILQKVCTRETLGFPWKKCDFLGLLQLVLLFLALSFAPATRTHPRILPDGRVVRSSWQLFGKVMLIRNSTNHHRKDIVHKTYEDTFPETTLQNDPLKIPIQMMIGLPFWVAIWFHFQVAKLLWVSGCGIFITHFVILMDAQHRKILRLDDPKFWEKNEVFV